TLDNLLYFSSDGQEGLGGLDIFEVKMKDDKPGKVYNMGKPINTSADDFAMALSEDKSIGYLSSNRSGDGSNDDIFKFDVLRVVKRGKTVNFVVKDKDSGEPLANAKLQINADSVRTNDKGEYQGLVEEDVNYSVTASKTKYFDAKDSVSTKSSEADEFTRTITLEKDPNLSLLAFVLDAKSNQALEGVKISIKDAAANKPFDEYTTPATGDYRKPLKGKKIGDKLNFVITLEKPGYLTKTVNFNYDITKEGEIKLNELLALTIGKIEVGMDLAKMIDMKPIYFDLGKSAVRKDAAIELDKVVAAMKQYPNMIIELGSHTDCRSSAAANLKLSNARAKASASYIVTKGKIDKKRITGKGYGESKLLNGCACEGALKSNCSEEEHAKNRRTEFIIVKLK
ncbi:MAG: OmpA family protein, partial [Bacteroidia bacterium]